MNAFIRTSGARFRILPLLIFLAALAACDTAQERAEKHYQSALALLEKGDVSRAIVEFRNVFKLDEQHRDARESFAELHRDTGDLAKAASHYLRLVEQYPEDVAGHRALAEILAEIRNWDDMARHVAAVQAIDPADPTTTALQVVFDYQDARASNDEISAKSAVSKARELIGEMPDDVHLRQVIVDDLARHNRFAEAIEELDVILSLRPDDLSVYRMRLSMLSALNEGFQVEAQLKQMIERFPDDRSIQESLVRWYVSQKQLDDAEAYLRSRVVANTNDPTEHLNLIRFLTDLRGRDQALAEVDSIIAGGNSSPTYLSLRSGLLFDMGDTEGAIRDIRAMLEGQADSAEIRVAKLGLAQMLVAVGRGDEAQTQVDEILDNDEDHVGALKMRANWLVDGDEVGKALAALRIALDNSPDDPEILTLMARAHERDGNQELMGEMLAFAVEVSGRRPAEAIRYARYLGKLEKLDAAENVLIEALRLAPSNVSILNDLGNLYVASKDWPRARQVIKTLGRIESSSASQAATQLNVRFLAAQNDLSAAVSYLEGLVADGTAGYNANVAIVRAYVANGEPEKARTHVDALLDNSPDDSGVLFMDAAVNAVIGKSAEAEETYRSLLESDERQLQVWISLYRLLSGQGRSGEATATVDQALAVLPDDPTLLWIRAGLLEESGEYEGAIAIYEDLYQRDSNNLVVANNLASLLSNHRTDPASINRAYIISRRLRLTSVPPYQDTYGWVSFLRGDYADARLNLEIAASALPGDPTVQYHLARVYSELERFQAAAEAYNRVVNLTGPADTREFVQHARTELSRLQILVRDAVND